MTTHYAPWDVGDDAPALCGHAMTATDLHMTQPSCPACAAALEALDAAIAATPLPLDADEAAHELDPLLNAGLPVPAPQQPSLFAADLFAYAVALNRAYAEVLR